MVVYTGRETKIQMNAAEPPVKYSSLKAYVDWETLRVLCLQVAISVACTVCIVAVDVESDKPQEKRPKVFAVVAGTLECIFRNPCQLLSRTFI